VVEVPVEREIDLTSRSVVIERRPPVSKDASNIISELHTEVFDTTEIPVVTKGTAVVEEVVIRREETTNRHVIRETIRRDDIQVEQPQRGLVPQAQQQQHNKHRAKG
jgi:stress response protein YsnF